MITYERLREVLDYDEETGVFTWKVRNGFKMSGMEAGTINHDGYKRIAIDKRHYMAHRLAWLYIHGYFPEHEIDHIDRDPSNNKINNLRESSRSCNCSNRNVRSDSSSGVTGVLFRKDNGMWTSNIVILGKRTHLGQFKTKLNAAKARYMAELDSGFELCNTTSSAYQYLKKHGAI